MQKAPIIDALPDDLRETAVYALVIWDNRGTFHRATPYAEDSGRMLHRVTGRRADPVSGHYHNGAPAADRRHGRADATG